MITIQKNSRKELKISFKYNKEKENSENVIKKDKNIDIIDRIKIERI